MKIVFYRNLLHCNNEMSPSEKILYSFLVSKSIARSDYIFNTDGKDIRRDELDFQLKENGNYCFLCDMSNLKISSELYMTRKTVIEGLKHLSRHRYVVGGNIFVIPYMIDDGYFELHHADILTGELLIFYSYLRDKAKKYDYVIDTYKIKIAENIGKSKIAVTKLLHRLYEANLAKRLDDGKLLIIK